ncbi:MAG: hypothetical protein ABIE42_08515 [Candidatus Eisenbacteria bacterium]
MISKAEARSLIDDLFEEEVLVIGGLVAIHDLDDDLVWRLVRSLSAIRGRVLRRLDDELSLDEMEPQEQRPKARSHPAVSEFLRSLRRD